MSDTFGKENQATPTATLEQQILDPNHPKSDREWWAAAEITALRAEIAWYVADKAKWQDTQTAHLAEITTLRVEAVQASQQLGDIPAIIHRDGGHHTADVGIEQSVKDAHIKWANLMTENEKLRDALTARVEELEGALERIDRIEVYDEDARETLRAKLGVMRDIARAALEVK